MLKIWNGESEKKSTTIHQKGLWRHFSENVNCSGRNTNCFEENYLTHAFETKYIYGPVARKLYHGLFPNSIFQSIYTAKNEFNMVSLYLWLYEKPRRPLKITFQFLSKLNSIKKKKWLSLIAQSQGRIWIVEINLEASKKFSPRLIPTAVRKFGYGLRLTNAILKKMRSIAGGGGRQNSIFLSKLSTNQI